METTLFGITQFLLLAGVSTALYILKKGLPAYLQEKGKNLATKEDIQKITLLAEEIKSNFTQLNTVHQVQFEAEFKAYQALWDSAHEVMVAHIRWQPIVFVSTDEKREDFVKSQLAFASAVSCHEPFTFELVWSEFKKLDEALVTAKSPIYTQESISPANMEASRKLIEQLVKQCAQAIKARLSHLLILKN